ncbi:MAG: energy transducer TonB [Halarcobacter sp.]
MLLVIPFNKIEIEKKQKQKEISLNYVQVLKAKPIEKEKIIEKVKVINKTPKKVIKKKAEIKKKKVLKKQKVIKKKIVKKSKKPKTKKQTIPIIAKKKILKKTIELKKDLPKVQAQNIVNYKVDFLAKNLALIKKHIQRNINYSKRARKMNIQGEVIVEFCLLKNGKIKDIKTLSGHRLLRKSTIKAIEKASLSFPKVSKNITIKLPINYKLI